MMASEAASAATSGLKVLGLLAAAMTKRPPGLPGSHCAASADGGKGCPVGRLGGEALPQPAKAHARPTKPMRHKYDAIMATHPNTGFAANEQGSFRNWNNGVTLRPTARLPPTSLSEQLEETLQFRVGVIEMRRKSNILLASAVGAQGSNDTSIQQIFMQRSQITAWPKE